MRILIIRHGDPDYPNDSLTPKGQREAELVADRLAREEIHHFFVSPLGRARATAAPTLRRFGQEAEVCTWLQEFPPLIVKPDQPLEQTITWDWLPADWTVVPEFYHPELWMETEVMRAGRVKEAYAEVAAGLDEILSRFGYLREGNFYRVEKPCRKTIALFCHFGLECVLLSHLFHVSPMVLWHGTALATTSVTTLYSEERRPGVALFRALSIGDLSHLYAAGEKPSFSARFCETYDDWTERHD